MSAPFLGMSAGVRASDAERERIAQILQTAAAEGRLSPEEAGERLAAASTATYREELHRLIADLPVAQERELAEPPFRRGSMRGFWVWGVARFAIAIMLVAALFGGWGAWGLRSFWPLGLVALFVLGRPWRRRWRHPAWHGRRFGWGTF